MISPGENRGEIPKYQGLADCMDPLGAPLCLTFLWWPTVGEQQWMGRSTSLCKSFSKQYTRHSSTFFCSGMAGKVCGGSLLLDGPAAAGGAVRHQATKQPPSQHGMATDGDTSWSSNLASSSGSGDHS